MLCNRCKEEGAVFFVGNKEIRTTVMRKTRTTIKRIYWCLKCLTTEHPELFTGNETTTEAMDIVLRNKFSTK